VLDVLAGVADRARFNPQDKITVAVSHGPSGHFYETRAAAAVAPILKCTNAVAENICCLSFVH
jgi:hypothetical protein